MTSQTMRLIHIEMLQNDTFVMIAAKKNMLPKIEIKESRYTRGDVTFRGNIKLGHCRKFQKIFRVTKVLFLDSLNSIVKKRITLA